VYSDVCGPFEGIDFSKVFAPIARPETI